MEYEVVWPLRYNTVWAAIHSVFTQCMFGQLPGNTGSCYIVVFRAFL